MAEVFAAGSLLKFSLAEQKTCVRDATNGSINKKSKNCKTEQHFLKGAVADALSTGTNSLG